MREAARIPRDQILASSDPLNAARSALCATLARAVWHSDAWLARILVDRSELAREPIYFDNGIVPIRDQSAFREMYNTTRADALALRRRDAEATSKQTASPASTRKSTLQRLAAIETLGKLWSPFGNQLAIHAVKVGDCSITDETDKLAVLP